MTTNQINYWNYVETMRANRAREDENRRSNIAREEETKRSNLSKEGETLRSNVARERETRRSNLANEVELGRHNAAVEANAERVRSDNYDVAMRKDQMDRYRAGTERVNSEQNFILNKEKNEITRYVAELQNELNRLGIQSSSVTSLINGILNAGAKIN